MAGRGRTSFQKRQKEQLRLERRQQKAAKKQERKTGEPESDIMEIAEDEDNGLTLKPGQEFDLDPAGGIRVITTDESQEQHR
jgi:hypothetical protein